MKTESTKIKDFKVGDRFVHYGGLFEVTGNVTTFDEKNPPIGYRAMCKFLGYENEEQGNFFGGLLTSYVCMQGTEEVTYAKVIE